MSTIEKALAKNKKTLANKPESTEEIKQSAPVKSEEQTVVVEPSSNSAANEAKAEIYIDNDKLTERGFLHSGGTAHHQQEEFRHIKRKLLNNAFGPAAKTLRQSNLVMVSSANPNEGKTFISINLALSIALEQDKTVLLVDADVLRPSLHRELEFENNTGLLDYLCGNSDDVAEIIYPTNIPNLRIMPAGRAHHLTNELLASDRMAQLSKELSQRYPDRIVVFDCPPLLGVTETPVLASLVGQAVVVAEESKTKLDDIKRATSQLDEELAVGFVLNKTIKTSKDIYGYYGYGYGRKK
ncbi:tyrosine-protein kinase family protein [Thalassotalea sp. M1531]|uniref:non-specific protein-tyrosine kinase n=1 Tax=Thalassotalea algicola TaxID=2716224 RepID=A0A7Y0LEK3_9GAMM|nr:XrtA-associated tyrosine autokinase [Thalassotalea algicola]NMP33073.1 tyrosine-protein kinase family protein [Thalassotalea algicola]